MAKKKLNSTIDLLYDIDLRLSKLEGAVSSILHELKMDTSKIYAIDKNTNDKTAEIQTKARHGLLPSVLKVKKAK
jgi:hypothetical protein